MHYHDHPSMVVIPSLLSVVLPHRRYPGSEPSAGGKAGSQGCSEERAEPLERPQIIVASTAPWKGASKPRTLLPAEGIQPRRTARAPPGRDAMMRHVALVPGVPLRFTPGYQLASLRLAILPANLWVKLRCLGGVRIRLENSIHSCLRGSVRVQPRPWALLMG